MKTLKFLVVLLLNFVVTTSIYGADFSSFKGSRFYRTEGRWFIVGDKFLFKVNEGNANEETIMFETNPHKLANKVKYKICLKIKKDCQLNCQAESIRLIKELKPWEDANPMIPHTDGQYFETSESTCKEAAEK